jgi:hypothetical protein
MSTYGDGGYEQALDEIEVEFGQSELGDTLEPKQYKENLINFILSKQDIDEIWKMGIFDLEDIVLQDWAQNRRANG